MRVREPVLMWVLLVGLTACRTDVVPKPRGYFRIDLPEKEYKTWDEGGPFKAEIASNALMEERMQPDGQRWYDLVYAHQKARVHLTHRHVEGRLGGLIEDAHTFKAKHEMMASRIKSHRISRDEARVHGSMFDVDGDVASPLVFYLTDSTQHFLYGALYFDARPNADSLAPVIARIREDMRHFAESLTWH